MTQDELDFVRQSVCKASTVSVPTSATQLVSHSDKRIALIISCPSTQTVNVGTSTAIAAGEGLFLPTNGVPLALSIDQFGTFITSQLFAIATGGTTNIGIVEVFSDS